jgi:hypothetical protein
MPTFVCHCPKCQRRHEFDESVQGRQRKCIQCGTVFSAFSDKAGAAGPAVPAKEGFQKGASRFQEAAEAGRTQDEEEPRKSPMPFVIGGAAVVVLGLVAFLVFGRGEPEGPPKKDEDKKGEAVVGVSPEEKLADEVRAVLAEAKARGAEIKDPSDYTLSLVVYEKIGRAEKKLEALAKIRGGVPVFTDSKLADLHKETVAKRKSMEAAYLKFVEAEIPKANSVAELLSGYARESMPELRDMIQAAVLRVRPELVHKESVVTLRLHAQRGTCHELSPIEREAWLFIIRAGDPFVAELFERNTDEALKLCVGDVTKDADALLPALLEKSASKGLAKQLYASALFRFGGKPKVRTLGGEATIEMPLLCAAIPKIGAKAGKLELGEHAEIVRGVYFAHPPEGWGDRFLDLMSINGDEPAYRAKLALSVIFACPPRDDGNVKVSLPALEMIKPWIKHLDEQDYATLMTNLGQTPTADLTQEKLAELIEKSPTPAALQALLDVSGNVNSPIQARAARLAAKCYAKGGDPKRMADALVRWARELDDWKKVFDDFLERGNNEEVSLAVQQLVETGPEKEFDAYLKLAGEVLARDAKNGAWIVPALLRSYQRVKAASSRRKDLIVKCKTDEALPTAVAIYAAAAAQGLGNEQVGNEFHDILKALLDKRACKFLVWVAFGKRERETWAVAELRRLSGQGGGLDADLWQKWYKANESKLPKQIETPEMGR